MTDLGFTGGGAGSGMVYMAGKQSHKLSNDQMVDHIVRLVEERAEVLDAEARAAEAPPSRLRPARAGGAGAPRTPPAGAPVSRGMAHVAGHLACDALAGIVEVVTLGLRAMAARIVWRRASSSALARRGARRSALSSWPRHMNSSPVQVTRTRLQLSQKLWVRGVMKPIFCPVWASLT